MTKYHSHKEDTLRWSESAQVDPVEQADRIAFLSALAQSAAKDGWDPMTELIKLVGMEEYNRLSPFLTLYPTNGNGHNPDLL